VYTPISCNTFFFFSRILFTLFKLKNNRIGQPKEHTTIDRDDTALASSSFFAQDDHQNAVEDSPSIVKGVVSSSASSYNDLFDVGILSKIRSRGAKSASTSTQHGYKTHAARMRLLASDIMLSDSPTAEELSNMSRKSKDLTNSALPSLRSGQGRILATVSEEGGGAVSNEEQYIKVKELEDLLQKLKLLYCAKASKLTTHWHSDASKFCKQDNDPATTTVVSRYTFTQPAPAAAPDATLIRGRNLQLGGLSQAAVEAYEASFLQELQSNPPAGTTVLSVDITSITEGTDGSLSFVFNATSVVACAAPCDQAQAEAESAAALEDVLATSVSSGGFAMALQANLANVTDCGGTTAQPILCDDLQASAANATVAADITSLDVCPSTKVIVCENGIATSVGGVAATPGTTCQEACEGNCCVGSQPCDGLTASICMDGKTCMDSSACKDANVGSIFLGCNGKFSCQRAGNFGGYIGSITNSCFNSRACKNAAIGGFIGQITNSCMGDFSCGYTAGLDGYIGEITNSCLSRTACYFAAYSRGFIVSITNSCLAVDSCKRTALEDITLGIVDSCNSTKACVYAASYGAREINTINNACNSGFACFKAAYFNVGDIPSGIIGCCNTGTATSASQGICYKANEITLSTQDDTCSSAPVSVSATADSDLINKDEIALGDFLLDLAHELYKLVSELAKNKKD